MVVRRQKISDSEICRRYREGAPRDELILLSGLPDNRVVEVLRRNGVPLRNDAEWRRIAIENRQRWKSTERLRARQKLLKRRRALEAA